MKKRRLKSPIFIVGVPRSGTTLLGWIFEAHPDVAYWPEPRLVWNTGNQQRPDDVLTEEHLDAAIAEKIDRRFANFLDKSGRKRFAEKTPTNILRLRFLYALYPDCRIVYLTREPFGPIYSMAQFETRRPDKNRLFARLREMRPADVPGLMKKAFSRNRGPRVPEWKNLENFSQPVRLARLWQQMTSIAERDLELIPDANWTQIAYSDLVQQPEETIQKLFAFAGLAEILYSELSPRESIDPTRAEKSIPPEFASAVKKELGLA